MPCENVAFIGEQSMSFLDWTSTLEKKKKRKAQIKQTIIIIAAIIMPFGVVVLTLCTIIRKVIK